MTNQATWFLVGFLTTYATEGLRRNIFFFFLKALVLNKGNWKIYSRKCKDCHGQTGISLSQEHPSDCHKEINVFHQWSYWVSCYLPERQNTKINSAQHPGKCFHQLELYRFSISITTASSMLGFTQLSVLFIVQVLVLQNTLKAEGLHVTLLT